MKLIAACFALLIGVVAQAQSQTIHGRVKAPDGKSLSNVTVVLKDTSNIVLHFTRSNAEGEFSFSLAGNVMSTVNLIEVNHTGFERSSQPVKAGQQVYNFQLQTAYTELPAVKVKNRPRVISKGDTLSYSVKSFSKEEDRNIGDVIKRMPGMTVDDEGKIYYNNKQIDNLYTDGDNLMDGRYGLATQVITKDMIQSVDVIQHHQPVEALRGNISSDKVAVNLVLKDDRKTSIATQAILGAGIPAQYEATLSTILLNRKTKMLNAIRANNSGFDYRNDFSELGNSSMLENINATNPDALLSGGTVPVPDLPRRNYYLNRSAIININQLFKSKNNIQYRANIQAFTDRQTMAYESNTRLLLNGDTASYREQQQSVMESSVMLAAFSLMANRSNYFVNNKLSVRLQEEKAGSLLLTNNTSFGQRLKSDKYAFTNDFSLIPALKNKAILELRWLLNYNNNPQRLQVDTGLHQGILNQDLPYEAMIQQAAVPTFFSHLSAGYMLLKGLIRQNYQAGLVTERQQLNTLLQLQQNDGTIEDYQRDAGNKLRWQRDRLFVQGNYSLQKTKYEISVTMPLILQQVNYKQNEYNLDERLQQLLFSPSARVKWLLNKEDYFTVNYSYNNNPGNITGVYRGAVLTNYRSLHASDADLQQVNRSDAGFYYSFQRSVSMLFVSAGMQYNRNAANFILASVVTDSIQRVVLLPYENTQRNFTASGSFSKYLFSVGGTFSLKFIYQQGRHNQLVNAVLLPYDNSSISIIPSWQGRLFRRVNFNYQAFLMRSGSYQKSNKDIGTHMQRMDQQLAFSFSPVSKILVQAKTRHIYSKQLGVKPVNYVFADLNIRYTHIKWRTDFELDCSNLSDVKKYEIYRQGANVSSQSLYNIRGRMLLFKATFNL